MCQTVLIFSIYYSQKESTHFGYEDISTHFGYGGDKFFLNYINPLCAKLF